MSITCGQSLKLTDYTQNEEKSAMLGHAMKILDHKIIASLTLDDQVQFNLYNDVSYVDAPSHTFKPLENLTGK